MGILFGTDGIRGVAGEHPLDRDTIYRIGHCLTGYLKPLSDRPRVLIARDTRISGPWIEALLQEAVHGAEGIPEPCGILSTPAVSFLAESTEAQAGIMISASHNPYQDNGIKIFSSEGMKLGDDAETALEEQILNCSLTAPADPTGATRFEPHDPAAAKAHKDRYIQHLRASLPAAFHLGGIRLVVDCAHGSQFCMAPEVLASLGADVRPIHCEPDGCNINAHAGALHLETLQREVSATGAQLGIAFDGDADRVMFVDSAGRIRDGDDVLYLLACCRDYGDAPRSVVGTVMANLGLEIALQERGYDLIRTPVGDRYVLEEMLRRGAVVGGEQSGHIILARLARTGDGLLTALKVLEILIEHNQDIAALCAPVKRFPQVLLNVPVKKKVPFEEIVGLQAAEKDCQKRLGSRSRILLRYSGTEPLARVMVEGEDEGKVNEAARILASFFEDSSASRK